MEENLIKEPEKVYILKLDNKDFIISVDEYDKYCKDLSNEECIKKFLNKKEEY